MMQPRQKARARGPSWVVVRLLFTVALLLVGGVAQAQVETCAGLGPALTEHSCFHSEFGPFTSVLATSGGAPNSATPAIDAVHTEFRIALTSSVESVVTYNPARTGQWVVFLGEDVPFELRDGDGASFTPLYEARGNTGCDALPIARAFALTAGVRYSFVFRPNGQRSVVTVVEYANDFLQSHGRDRDGDGWGDPNDLSAPTVCFPAEGYAARLGDCDDEDPDVHPGAVEICDEIDQNCNGVPDDVGLRCTKGRGACAGIGKFECLAPQGEATCVVDEEKLPSAEVCNGVDDDCNGVIDDGSSLCVDEDAPSCVREETGAFCGCLLDLDCGPPESGMTCDRESRRCVRGCSTTPGNNGCPQGQVCITEGEGPGSCRAEDEPDEEPEPDDPDEPGEPLAPGDDAGCSCQSGPGRRAPGAGWLLALLFAGGALARSRGARRWFGALLFLFGSSACGGTVVSDSGDAGPGGEAGASGGDDSSAPCVPLLAEAPAKHACSHGMNGPFEDVVGALDEAAGPVVDRVHVPYWIEFRGGAGSSAWVSYRATRAGEHVVFTAGADQISVVRRGGVGVELRPLARTDSCSVFDAARAVTLEKGETYAFRLRSSAEQPVLWFVEHLGSFGARAFVETCDE